MGKELLDVNTQRNWTINEWKGNNDLSIQHRALENNGILPDSDRVLKDEPPSHPQCQLSYKIRGPSDSEQRSHKSWRRAN